MKKKIFAIILCCLACAVLTTPVFANLEANLAKMDSVAGGFLHVAQRIGYWIIAIKGIYDIGKSVLNGDRAGMMNTLMTCLLIYGGMFLLPWALRFVENMF